MLLAKGAETIGFDDVGDGDALVLLHAFPLDRRMWQAQVRGRAPSVRAITIDFRGLGESSGGGTIDDAADDLLHVLDKRRIDRAIVGGLSMGGYVALAFARRHPARLAGLLLADTRANADDDAGRKARDEAITRVIRQGLDAYLDGFLPRLMASPPSDLKLTVAAIASSQSVNGVTGALAALRDRPDATPYLGDIRVPTTVLVGGKDLITPPEVARQLAAAIPGATLVEIPDVGHLTSFEAPFAFTEAVDALVERVRAASI